MRYLPALAFVLAVMTRPIQAAGPPPAVVFDALPPLDARLPVDSAPVVRPDAPSGLAAPAAENREPGTLTVKARSWAVVEVDGKTWGQTPIQRRRLEAGRHRLVLINDTQDRHDTRWVTIRPGEHETLSLPW